MDRYKVFRDETYVYYVDANSLEEAQEIANDTPQGEGKLLSIHNEVIEKMGKDSIWKEND
tara:strand:- start:43 stop:222 length:180 start_codon:yes stop_codon:yes gene_type:complete